LPDKENSISNVMYKRQKSKKEN